MPIEPIKYAIHPAADLFPLMSEAEFAGLKADIKEWGQREDIIGWCGKIIDGRNRLRACQELGIEPSIADLDDHNDPIAYVISHNLHRRHLTTSQRSDVAAKIATMRQGARTDLGSKDTKSIEESAKQMSVSPASVKRAKKVHAKGSDETKKAVSDGSLLVTTAAKFVDAVPDKAEQAAIVAKGAKAVKEAAKAVKEAAQPVLKRVGKGKGVPKPTATDSTCSQCKKYDAKNQKLTTEIAKLKTEIKKLNEALAYARTNAKDWRPAKPIVVVELANEVPS